MHIIVVCVCACVYHSFAHRLRLKLNMEAGEGSAPHVQLQQFTVGWVSDITCGHWFRLAQVSTPDSTHSLVAVL
jgi:hypothetical protein